MKSRFISSIAALAVTLSILSFGTSSNALKASDGGGNMEQVSQYLLGDVNGDGKINSTDYSFVKKYILAVINDFPVSTGKLAADVNKSGTINSTDISLLKRFILGIITVFPDSSAIYKDPKASVAKRVEDLISRMTIEEKIGQMVQAERKVTTAEDVRNYYLGSVLSGGGSAPDDNSAKGWMSMIKAYQDGAQASRLGIPLIYGTDAVHGHNNVSGAVIFPHNIGLGAANNPELIKEIGRVTSEELLATGVNWNFGPCVAVVRDDRWGRTYESYSENPELVKRLSIPLIETYQKGFGIVATAKHFIADGGTTGGIDQGDAKISEEELRKIHLPVYKEAVEKGVKTVMISFSSWNGLKNHENKYLVTDVLKKELGFDGFVVSDWEAIHQLSGATYYEQVSDCVNAGVDMIMEPTLWKECIDALKSAVQKGDITEARLNDAVGRILKVKFEMGLFEKPLGDQSLITSELGSKEHKEVAKKAVRESMVLLKNEKNVLPLKKNAKIFVTGRAADNMGIQCGGWTRTWLGGYDVFGDRFVPGTTILEGFKNIAQESGGTIITDPSRASEADVAVAVIGELPYAEIYGAAKDLSLMGETLLYENTQALEDAKNSGLPVVTVMISGRPRVITNELKDWDAFVEAWLPGSEGDAVADVLYGDYDFKGKLPVVWPASTEQEPINADEMKNQTPLFPYGFGLKMFQ